MRIASGCAVAVVLAVGVGLPAIGVAQSDPSKQEAKQHYERGLRLYEVGKYMESVDEYQKAYELSGEAVLLYNIAQAYRLADQPELAVRAYRNYLRRDPKSKQREVVEQRITELEKVLEDRKRSPQAQPPAPPPASPQPPLQVPPMPYPPPPTQPPPPGDGSTISPFGQPPGTSAAPPGAAARPVGVSTPAQAARPSGSGKKIGGFVCLGVGGALLVTSVIEAVRAQGKAKIIADASVNGGRFDEAADRAGRTANGVAIATGVVGVAAASLGGYLVYSATRAPSGPPSPASIKPLAARDFVGAEAEIRF